MPTSSEILPRHLDTLDLIKRAVSGGKLKAHEVLDCIDFLNGLTQLSYRYASDSRNARKAAGFYGRSRFVVLKITVLSEDIWH